MKPWNHKAQLFQVGGRTLLLPLLLACLTTASVAGAKNVPVLLTFDTEDARDAAAIRELALSESATFFITGQFASHQKALVRKLSQRHTVGSHSYNHSHLADYDITEIKKDLLLAKMVLEDVTGKASRWFRAPYLEYTKDVLQVLGELNYHYDCSIHDETLERYGLISLPISRHPTTAQLISDDTLFLEEKFNGEQAVAWLKERYREQRAVDDPLVVLLHPHIIVHHKAALLSFMNHVRGAGGTFYSAEQWISRTATQQDSEITEERHTSHILPVQSDSSTGHYSLPLLLVASGLTALTLLTWLIFNNNRTHTLLKALPSTTPGPPHSASRHIDWRDVAQQINNNEITQQTFKHVSTLLRSMEAAKIASFRMARILETISQQKRYVDELLIECTTFQEGSSHCLRYIEEANLMGFLTLSNNMASITPTGQQHLHSLYKRGYSSELLSFIEERVAEFLYFSCPNCDASISGHWFWERLECPTCNHSIHITQQTDIQIVGRRPVSKQSRESRTQ